jgi:hypothetical protein
MDTQNQHLEALKDIKQMMERSSRFISLSGLSGIAAGCCALVGAWFAKQALQHSYYSARVDDVWIDNRFEELFKNGVLNPRLKYEALQTHLIVIATLTFLAAFTLSFLFTWLRSKKEGIAVWGKSSQRLMFNVAIPMLAGAAFVIRMWQTGYIGFVAPSCLIFYGLALIHGSKYTLGEVRYLGYGQLILGTINLWCVGYGLYFWAVGFGVLHILYGAIMWWKYERN